MELKRPRFKQNQADLLDTQSIGPSQTMGVLPLDLQYQQLKPHMPIQLVCSPAPYRENSKPWLPLQARMRNPAAPNLQLAAIAQHGLSGSATDLPHREQIQRSFGHNDVSNVRAHTSAAASDANEQMGSLGYATSESVAFRGQPDLHTAAHEAAHVMQQRAGVQLKGGVGQVGDVYEQQADAVADRVVQGRSAAPLLDRMGSRGVGGGGSTVQFSDQPEEEAQLDGSAISELTQEQLENVQKVVDLEIVDMSDSYPDLEDRMSAIDNTTTAVSKSLSNDSGTQGLLPLVEQFMFQEERLEEARELLKDHEENRAKEIRDKRQMELILLPLEMLVFSAGAVSCVLSVVNLVKNTREIRDSLQCIKGIQSQYQATGLPNDVLRMTHNDEIQNLSAENVNLILSIAKDGPDHLMKIDQLKGKLSAPMDSIQRVTQALDNKVEVIAEIVDLLVKELEYQTEVQIGKWLGDIQRHFQYVGRKFSTNCESENKAVMFDEKWLDKYSVQLQEASATITIFAELLQKYEMLWDAYLESGQTLPQGSKQRQIFELIYGWKTSDPEAFSDLLLDISPARKSVIFNGELDPQAMYGPDSNTKVTVASTKDDTEETYSVPFAHRYTTETERGCFTLYTHNQNVIDKLKEHLDEGDQESGGCGFVLGEELALQIKELGVRCQLGSPWVGFFLGFKGEYPLVELTEGVNLDRFHRWELTDEFIGFWDSYLGRWGYVFNDTTQTFWELTCGEKKHYDTWCDRRESKVK